MLVEDVRSQLREWGGRKGQPTAVVIAPNHAADAAVEN
jgi:hypothetical protein